MPQILILFSLFVLTSCTFKKQASNLSSHSLYCPGFAKNSNWKPSYTPPVNMSELMSQQKFAVLPEQKVFWFSFKNKYLGMCIPPITNKKRITNDCGTIYVTYRKDTSNWKILKQQVTICPG